MELPSSITQFFLIDTQNISPFFQDKWNSIMHLLVHPLVPWTFAGFIFLIYVYQQIAYFARLHPILRSLRNGLQTLSTIEGPRQFFEKYESIREIFLGNRYTKEAWEEFDKTIIPRDGDSPGIVSTSRPDEFFNDASIVFPNINVQLFQAIPNLLIGLGLLLTFIGLVAAIHVASEGLNGNAENSQEALKNLLTIASFKFISSITGLLTSLLFSVYQKGSFNKLHKRISAICRKLELLTVHRTLEQLIDESLDNQKKQSVTLEHLATQIGTQVAQALSEKLPASVTQALQPLADSLKMIAEKMSSTNEDRLEKMITSFNNKLESTTGNHMLDLVTSLKAMQNSMTTVLSKIDEAGSSFGTRISGAAVDLSDKLNPIAKTLLTFDNNIRDINEKTALHLVRFDTAIQALDLVLGKLNSTAENMAGAGQPIVQASEGIRTATRSIEAAYIQVTSAYQKIEGLSQSTQEIAKSINIAWDNHEKRFSQVDQSLESAFQKINEGMDAFKANAHTFVRELDQSLSSSVQLLSGAIGELHEMYDENIQKKA